MANEEKINLLLTDIRSLEELVSGIQHAEIYPVSFFSRSFDLSQKIITQLHKLEEEQLEMLREQMEAHKGVINRIKESVKVVAPIENIVPEFTPAAAVEEATPVHTLKTNTNEVIEEIIPEVEVVAPTPAIPETQKEEIPIENEIAEEISPSPAIENTDKTEIAAIPPQEKTTISLIEVLEKKNLSDFRKAFSLNDRFRFRRELFKGDEALMNKVISELNDIESLQLSLEYLAAQFDWDQEEESVSDFIKLLEKRFL